MKKLIRKWLGVPDLPEVYLDTVLYAHDRIGDMEKTVNDALREVGLHPEGGGVVNINGVAVKFSDRLDSLEQWIIKLESKMEK